MIEAIEETLTEKNCFHLDLCSGEIHKAIHSISHLIEGNINKANLPNRFAVTKVIEGNEDIIKQLQLDDHQLHIIDPVSYTHLDVYKRQPKYKPILVIVAAPIAIVRANGNDFSKTVVKKFPFTCSKLASYVKKNVGIPTPQVLIKES